MHDVRLTRRLDSPIDAVWRAWTDEDAFASWFWPSRLEPEYALDARVGGLWRVGSLVASLGVGGTFLEVTEQESLAFTWRWDGEIEESTVSVRLTPARGNATLLDVNHDGIASVSAAADLRQGWDDCLDRLPAALSD